MAKGGIIKINKNDPIVLSDGTTVNPANVGVFDAAHQQIPFVFGFDTDTCEVEMLIKLRDESGEVDGEMGRGRHVGGG